MIDMGISSIEIKNLLSFDRLLIDNVADINCIVGKNNVGKSNLLKLINYFYGQLDGKREISPELNSNYSSYGSITIEYNTSRIRKIVTSNTNVPYFKHIYNTLFKPNVSNLAELLAHLMAKNSSYKLTLTINKNNSIEWSTKNRDVLSVISYIYPFFEIQTRHIDLYDWSKLWELVSRLKSFRVNKLTTDEIVSFFNEKLSDGGNDYKEYVGKIQKITQAVGYSYKERVLNYIKVGLEGHTFLIDGQELLVQSDGTNSYQYIEIFLNLLISLTRRDYISPFVYIDEPEIGLHPKLSEKLIAKMHSVYFSFKKTKESKEKGRYATPYPTIFFSTHSPNIIKSIVKLFAKHHRVYHFSKARDVTAVRTMNSQYNSSRFLNVFSDNEARLFFSSFIMFVEGATEVELFGNQRLAEKFTNLLQIDVYEYDSVMLEALNPEFSNAAIPYLVLYDLDVIINVDFNNKKIDLRNGYLNLRNLVSKYKCSYYGSREYELKNNIKKLISYSDKSKVLFDSKNLFIDGIESMGFQPIRNLVDFANKEIFNHYSHAVTSTTIEGVLINEKSEYYFKKWLHHEIFCSLNVADESGISSKVNAFKVKTTMTSILSVTNAMASLLTLCEKNDFLSFDQKCFIVNLKKNYIALLLQEIRNGFPTDREALTALRLIFKGKTDTLVSLENSNKNKLNANFVADVEALSARLKPLEYLIGKTSGWVTRFIDFAIKDIEKNYKNNEFEDAFSRIFPELYDILIKLQPR